MTVTSLKMLCKINNIIPYKTEKIVKISNKIKEKTKTVRK